MTLYFRLFGLIVVIALFSILSIHHKSSTSQNKGANLVAESVTNNTVIKSSKWIVVTSINSPTKDVKNLAQQNDWTLIVVADKKTPADWSYPGVHFLSIEEQEEFFGKFAKQMPYNSYTRKNLGYLYAIMNGAEWIYDTDDDNKPFDLGLKQFDYSDQISGLRYISNSKNVSEQLFNPYRFYGFDNMWPRGFPLEYLRGHSNGNNRMVSCKTMPASAVQQGIVRIDPDVDAIYRPRSGLNVTFNSVAPPIVLESGTYSPWNSQNTLFNYRAFFTLFLPTTVEFRVTDIWRSYFGQKLLHLIGENVAFYPVNAEQLRNAHNYLKDFNEENEVYKDSGNIVKFLDNFRCTSENTADCVLELADGFVTNKFFGQEDKDLIEEWLNQLKTLNYQFPPLVAVNFSEEQAKKYKPTGINWANCREANLDFGTARYDLEDLDIFWSIRTLAGFEDLQNWCEFAQNLTNLPSPRRFLELMKEKDSILDKKKTVLVFINNYPWLSHNFSSSNIGILQRLYAPFFKTTIFCGTWDSNFEQSKNLPVDFPINFINITREEMNRGNQYGYCVSKIRELRLRNVMGYYFVADDTVFNFWEKLTLDNVGNPTKMQNSTTKWDSSRIKKVYNLIENKYKNDEKIQASWKKYQNQVFKQYGNDLNFTAHFLNMQRCLIDDWFYLSSNIMDLMSDLMDVYAEARVYVGVAIGKTLDGWNYAMEGDFRYLWESDRKNIYKIYNENLLGLHPLKLTSLHKNKEEREQFCSTVISTFRRKIYEP